jgi:hypothetical protein
VQDALRVRVLQRLCRLDAQPDGIMEKTRL